MNSYSTTQYNSAADQPQLVLAPATTFLAISGAGAPATPVWHRKKKLVTELARRLQLVDLAPQGPIAEHMRYHYLDSMPFADIANFYSVNPLGELHYQALARVDSSATLEDVAEVRRSERSEFDEDDEIELVSIPAELVIQVMHHGPFSGELATLARLGAAAESLGVVRSGPHQEIHLDPFTVSSPQENLRTILRDPVAPRSAAQKGGDAADRLAAAEALYRYAAGIDLKDDELLSSAFASDAVADLSKATAKVGLQYPAIEGRETIVAALSGSLAQLITTHSVSNPRVIVAGETATLEAIVAAQHLPAGDRSRLLLMTNRYELDLVRRGDRWLIQRLTVDNVWIDGDTSVLSGT